MAYIEPHGSEIAIKPEKKKERTTTLRQSERAVCDEHDPDCTRSFKVRIEMDDVRKCFKDVYKQ